MEINDVLGDCYEFELANMAEFTNLNMMYSITEDGEVEYLLKASFDDTFTRDNYEKKVVETLNKIILNNFDNTKFSVVEDSCVQVCDQFMIRIKILKLKVIVNK